MSSYKIILVLISMFLFSCACTGGKHHGREDSIPRSVSSQNDGYMPGVGQDLYNRAGSSNLAEEDTLPISQRRETPAVPYLQEQGAHDRLNFVIRIPSSERTEALPGLPKTPGNRSTERQSQERRYVSEQVFDDNRGFSIRDQRISNGLGETTRYLSGVLLDRVGLTGLGTSLIEVSDNIQELVVEPIDEARTFRAHCYEGKVSVQINRDLDEFYLSISISF